MKLNAAEHSNFFILCKGKGMVFIGEHDDTFGNGPGSGIKISVPIKCFFHGSYPFFV